MKMLFVVSLLLLSSCTTHYYVVRHAEKANTTDASPLTALGTQRAEDLKNYMLPKEIKRIYASTLLRTQLTAQPLATALNQSIILYRRDTSRLFAEKLKRMNGMSILVVGHTPDIPEIVNVLSNETISAIPETDYDNLYHVKVVKQLFWTSRYLTVSTYGAPSP
jgi:2,3-bisphosphoglycerate-dependent phosphoglycerate mutase